VDKRIVVAVIVVGLLAVVGYLANARISELESQVAGLDRQLQNTERQLAASDARAAAAATAATAARSRADEAEERAAAARADAEEAAIRAEQAEIQVRVSDADRAAAEEARQEAQRAREVAEMESEAAQELARVARDAEAEARAQARAAEEEAARIRLQREAELNRMQEVLDSIVETRRTAIGMVLNLGDRVEFEFDKAELRPAERELLARIAGVLIATAGQGYAIQVFGHTDDVGTAEYNQQLSERRAQAVMDYLVETGVNPDIITMQGMGKSMPLLAETTEEARARNRRVEIAIVDTLIEFRGERDGR
jgi:outer membrane protein OmpA-like peptidoglycan-associated protein